MKTPGIGIDFGTTSSRVAVFENHQVHVIDVGKDKKAAPSCVCFTDFQRLTGEEAWRQAEVFPRNTVVEFKRLIGRHFEDPNFQDHLKQWPFTVVMSDSGKPQVELKCGGRRRQFAPEQVCSMTLASLRRAAEKHLGVPVRDAVITVPPCFSQRQRQAVLDAARLAGLDVPTLLHEPIAAALYHCQSQANPADTHGRTFVVFDFGGGHVHASVIKVGEKGGVNVLSSTGNSNLGGTDLDTRILKHLSEEYTKRYSGQDLRGNYCAVRRLRSASEKAKRDLSSSYDGEASIELDALFEGRDYYTTLTQQCFDELCRDLWAHVTGCLDQALLEARVGKTDIHQVLMLGGSSRIPKVQQIVRNYFGDKPVRMLPESTVVTGAALVADMHSKPSSCDVEPFVIHDIATHELVAEITGSNGIVGGNTIVIARNSNIPSRQRVTIDACGQSTVVNLLEDKNLLGSMSVRSGLPESLVPELEIGLEVDTSGVVSASVKDLHSGISDKLPLDPSHTAELQKWLHEAETLRMEDESARAREEARECLEDYAMQIRRATHALSTVVTQDDRRVINTACDQALRWLDTNLSATPEDCERHFLELQSVCAPLVARAHGREKSRRQIYASAMAVPTGHTCRQQSATSRVITMDSSMVQEVPESHVLDLSQHPRD